VSCHAAGRIRAADEVDHVVPLAIGGPDTDDNLQALCIDCHRRKSAAERGVRRAPTYGADGQPAEHLEHWLR
jgi:5-methylcytosine-specific restriction protein A